MNKGRVEKRKKADLWKEGYFKIIKKTSRYGGILARNLIF